MGVAIDAAEEYSPGPPEGSVRPMSRTTRHAYDGQPIRDGQHGRRCPSAHCEWCSKGRTRRQKPQPEEDQ